MTQAHPHKIAIIGFGFSGLMTLRHLVIQTGVTYEIHVYDEKRMWSKGLAYATNDPQHLLNVRASRMGAFAENPEDFLRWLTSHQVRWRELHDDFADKEYNGDSFVPRMIYGAYLEDIMTATREIAKQNGHDVHLHDGKVQHITLDLRFITESEESYADKIILATGHYGARELPADPACQHHSALLHSPWQPAAAKAFRLHYNSREWGKDSHIVVLGTGLSAVDMLHSLDRLGFPGKVTALSRHGNLPETHAESTLVTLDGEDVETYPDTAQELYAKLHEEITAHGENWRGYVDGLRPHTNAIWQRLPDEEKQRFIDGYLHWWSIKRHRMSADSSELVARWQETGKLKVRAATLEHIGHDGEHFLLKLESARPLRADAVINASGYRYRAEPSRGGLVAHLQHQGVIRPSSLGIGIDTDKGYRASEHIYALGPLLSGTRLETVAVTELRHQAQELAEAVHQDILGQPPHHPKKPGDALPSRH